MKQGSFSGPRSYDPPKDVKPRSYYEAIAVKAARAFEKDGERWFGIKQLVAVGCWKARFRLGSPQGSSGAMAIVLGLNLGHETVRRRWSRTAAWCRRSRASGCRGRRRTPGVSKTEIDYVLDIAGCKLTDVDVIAFTTYNYAPDNYVKILKLNGEEVRHNLWDHPPRVMTLDFRARSAERSRQRSSCSTI
jgi:hypothetical protein